MKGKFIELNIINHFIKDIMQQLEEKVDLKYLHLKK